MLAEDVSLVADRVVRQNRVVLDLESIDRDTAWVQLEYLTPDPPPSETGVGVPVSEVMIGVPDIVVVEVDQGGDLVAADGASWRLKDHAITDDPVNPEGGILLQDSPLHAHAQRQRQLPDRRIIGLNRVSVPNGSDRAEDRKALTE